MAGTRIGTSAGQDLPGAEKHTLAAGRVPWVCVALVAVVYVVGVVLLPKEGFWVIDQANKFLQLRAALESGYRSVTIPWLGQAFDPQFQFNPLPQPFSVVQGGKLYSIFCPVFALLSSLPYRLLDIPGLYVLPLLGGLGVLAGAGALARHAGLSVPVQAGAILITGLMTPVWFYSSVFWEHTPAAALVVWSLVFLYRHGRTGSLKPVAGAALLLGLAIWLRDELYLAVPVLLGVLLAKSPGRRLPAATLFLTTGFLSLIPLWLVNWHYTGHPTGFHLSEHLATSEGIIGHLWERPTVFHRLLTAMDLDLTTSLVLALPFLILFLRNPCLSTPRFRLAVPIAALLALASFCYVARGYLWGIGPLWHILNTNSLLATSPILILAFIRHQGQEGERDRRLLWWVILAYVVLYGLAAPRQGTYGIHWGTRFLLPLYPLIGILCASTLVEWFRVQWRPGDADTAERVTSGSDPAEPADAGADWEPRPKNEEPRWGPMLPVGLALAASLSAQVYSIHLLGWAQTFSNRLNRELAARSEPAIVTNCWFLPQMAFRTFPKRPIFYIKTREDADQLLGRLRQAGMKQILLVEAVTFSKQSSTAVPAEEIHDGGLGLYSMRLVRMELAQ